MCESWKVPGGHLCCPWLIEEEGEAEKGDRNIINGKSGQGSMSMRVHGPLKM